MLPLPPLPCCSCSCSCSHPWPAAAVPAVAVAAAALVVTAAVVFTAACCCISLAHSSPRPPLLTPLLPLLMFVPPHLCLLGCVFACARPCHLVPARLCWFPPVCAGPHYLLVRACLLVLPFICTRVRLPSAHVLTCVRSCWSPLLACSHSFGPLCPHVRARLHLSCCSFVLARLCWFPPVCVFLCVCSSSCVLVWAHLSASNTQLVPHHI